MARLSDEELARDLALCEAATAGPWERVAYGGDWADRAECLDVSRFLDDEAGKAGAYRRRQTIFSGCGVRPEDVAFACAAREGWPAAIREVRRLRTLLARFLDHEAGRCDVKGGFCYSHEFNEPCPVAGARQALGKEVGDGFLP